MPLKRKNQGEDIDREIVRLWKRQKNTNKPNFDNCFSNSDKEIVPSFTLESMDEQQWGFWNDFRGTNEASTSNFVDPHSSTSSSSTNSTPTTTSMSVSDLDDDLTADLLCDLFTLKCNLHDEGSADESSLPLPSVVVQDETSPTLIVPGPEMLPSVAEPAEPSATVIELSPDVPTRSHILILRITLGIEVERRESGPDPEEI